MAYDPNTLKGGVDSAPEAGFSPMNFGRLTVEPFVVTWAGDKGSRVKSESPLGKGQALKQGETLEINFAVNISELNPQLEFEYERRVVIRKSSARVKTDWTEIVEPSLIAVFGADWPTKVAKSPYVCVEDAANVAGKASAKTGKVFGVPKFLAAYKGITDCAAAREKQFGAPVPSTPTEQNGVVPANIRVAFFALKTALVNSPEMLPDLVSKDPTYSGWTLEQLDESVEASH